MRYPPQRRPGIMALMALSVVFWSAGIAAGAIYFLGVSPRVGLAIGGIFLLTMAFAMLLMRFEIRRAVEIPPEAGDFQTPGWRAGDLLGRQRFGSRPGKRSVGRVGQRRSPERRDYRPLVRKD